MSSFYFTANKLNVGYDKKTVVSDIEITLKKGQVLSIIGPNGAGKSTVLKSIMKQLKILSGQVYINSNSITDINNTQMAKQAAVVLTKKPRPELVTCSDIVAMGRYPYTGALGILSQKDRQMVDSALHKVDAYELKDRSFLQISDGQMQRVLLARAICQEPQLIVLDEPTSFLDIRYAVDILDILRNMADSGVTVIMSVHELSYAKRISDLVMCIKDGSVMYLDSPENIFNKDIISSLYDLPEGVFDEIFGGL